MKTNMILTSKALAIFLKIMAWVKNPSEETEEEYFNRQW